MIGDIKTAVRKRKNQKRIGKSLYLLFAIIVGIPTSVSEINQGNAIPKFGSMV